MRINLIVIAAALALVAGCKGKKAEQQFVALPFPDVQLPAMIDSQEAAVEYLAYNYWNGFTDPSRTYPSDSALVSGVRRTTVEQKFADWTSVLDMAQPEVAEKAIARMYDRALACERKNGTSNVFETLAFFCERYFYDPNSPLRNEERYLPFVRKYASYEGLDEATRGKYERQVRMCSLNRVGQKAADFRFADRMGNFTSLYDIKSEYTLLFFSNPGCEACMQIINVLNSDPLISSLIQQKRLAVVNVYIDEDIQAWRSYMPIYPEEWYNGFDPDFVLKENTLYNIRAIPSLYLLDSDKRVIMKDAPEERLFNYLSLNCI